MYIYINIYIYIYVCVCVCVCVSTSLSALEETAPASSVNSRRTVSLTVRYIVRDTNIELDVAKAKYICTSLSALEDTAPASSVNSRRTVSLTASPASTMPPGRAHDPVSLR